MNRLLFFLFSLLTGYQASAQLSPFAIGDIIPAGKSLAVSQHPLKLTQTGPLHRFLNYLFFPIKYPYIYTDLVPLLSPPPSPG